MNRMDHKKMHDDLFIEMLDVFFNSILYLRDVYPSAIFRRRRIYSTAIYASIYPPLNEYLEKILKTALELKTERKLRKVELIIFREEQSIFDDVDDDDIIEKYVFQVEEKEESRTQDIANLPEYLLKFEDDLRQALAQLNYVLKNMKPLQSAECSFRIELETTEKAFVELVNRTNSQAEDFPWIRANEVDDAKSPDIWRFLPIIKNNQFNMQFQTLKKP